MKVFIMRVSSFSRLSVIAIGIFALIFLSTMYKVVNSLTLSKVQHTNYQHLKTLTSVELFRTITNYLHKGDATLLTKAEKQLTDIANLSSKLTLTNLAENIKQQATSLNNNLNTKYRAMGKLSGDPLVLIKLSEQDLVALNHTLAKYAQQSNVITTSQRLQYLSTTENIATVLSQLISARENMFAQQYIDQSNVNNVFSELVSLSSTLQSFPLLAIADESIEVDEFSFDDDEETDLSIDALNEFISISQRYKNEISNTFDEKRNTEQGLNELAQEVQALEQLIIQGEQALSESQEILNKQLSWTVVGLLTFLVIFLAANYWLQRSVILKPLRKLRDSFVQLVEQGKVDNITGIPPETELGEISTSFNNMVNKLAQDDMKKADQLALVSTALTSMESQVTNISDSSKSTGQHVQAAREIMIAFGQATETVNVLSGQVVDSAQATQKAMEVSQSHVAQVISASQSTSHAAKQGKEAITSLSNSVQSVTSIVDVISAIADQTNLLALNAAIEAARAGAHGRGFSVVADEVRQLAGKTQESLQQISERLSHLQDASNSIEKTIIDIEKASENQHGVAGALQETAQEVTGQAVLSSNVAQETLEQLILQKEHFVVFEQAMVNVDQEVNQSQVLASNINDEVSNHVLNINQTLNVELKEAV